MGLWFLDIADIQESGKMSLATRLAANENTGFLLSLVKPQPGDISIVDKPGTLLMWYDNSKITS
jgi:hypothetical protein